MRIFFLCILCLVVGCQASERQDRVSASQDALSRTSQPMPTPAVNQGEVPDQGSTASPRASSAEKKKRRPKKRLVLPSQMTPEETLRFESHQASLRAKHFKIQRPLAIPDEIVKAMAGVIPAGMEHKATGYELHHNMALVRLKPGRYFMKIRWVTLLRGPALKSALRTSLSQAGWVLNDHFFDRGDSVHPQRGRLRIELSEPAERSTMVTATIERQMNDLPVKNPLEHLSFPTPWAKAISEKPMGYEFSHFRDVHPGSSFTDIERAAVGYRPLDRETFNLEVRRAAFQAGYTSRGRASKKLVGPHGSSVLPLSTDPDYVVVHAMKQYGHPRKDGTDHRPQ